MVSGINAENNDKYDNINDIKISENSRQVVLFAYAPFNNQGNIKKLGKKNYGKFPVLKWDKYPKNELFYLICLQKNAL
jgi:hypothetical protein